MVQGGSNFPSSLALSLTTSVIASLFVSFNDSSFNLSGHRQIRKLQGKKLNGEEDDEVSGSHDASWLFGFMSSCVFTPIGTPG